MDIKSAKNTIKNTVRAYLEKDEYGDIIIPVERQRPIFLMGPPGIGKTAIMNQIARELKIGLVSYSITHHTRQSALGLPFIVEKEFAGVETKITEYTMSEIIAAVYEEIDNKGYKQGILFIDEINSASETLAPTMLQFLQSKTFGTHKVPEGWLIVGAGNPPEYNKSVKEYDIVTLDRIKTIEVEANYEVWKEYAYQKQIHSAIISYLDIFQNNFYFAETTVDGLKIVTPRGWEDLSEIIKMYERLQIEIDLALIEQYIQQKRAALDFYNYYTLYNTYKRDYDIELILTGKYISEEYQTMNKLRPDQKFAIISLLAESLNHSFYGYKQSQSCVEELFDILNDYKLKIQRPIEDIFEFNHKYFQERILILDNKLKISPVDDRNYLMMTKAKLKNIEKTLNEKVSYDQITSFKIIKNHFDKIVKNHNSDIKKINTSLSNVFKFIIDIFKEEDELIIFMTELTINPYSVTFLSNHYNEYYFKYNQSLLVEEQRSKIMREIKSLN